MLFSVPIRNYRKKEKNAEKIRQIHRREGTSFGPGLRLLSALLCMTLLAGFSPVQSAASEPPPGYPEPLSWHPELPSVYIKPPPEPRRKQATASR